MYLMVEKYRMSNDSSFDSTVNIANGVAEDDNPVRYIFCHYPVGSCANYHIHI